MNEDMAANRAKRQANPKDARGNGGMCDQVAPRNLTWVGGNRNAEDLDETSQKILAATVTGTSIFDPVLCELAYRWFCPPGGLVLDPFAGGSVRGIVAAKCGRRYIGIDVARQSLRRQLTGKYRPQTETATLPDRTACSTRSGLAPKTRFAAQIYLRPASWA